MTVKDARALATQIAKESQGIRVSHGKTNGRPVLHLTVPGSNSQTRTIKSAAEWENHPMNLRVTRNHREAEMQPTEVLMERNGS